MSYSATEMMTVAAARALGTNDVCFVGIGLPSAACNLARLTHAPGITLIYESGTIATKPSVLPLSIGDGELCETALTTVSVPEMFRYWLQGGRITVGFLSGAQVDRFGNLNSTVIGDYRRPGVRLPGAGGASEIAASCGRVLIVMRHTPRAFVPQVDFVTTLGHGRTGRERRELGISTAGPVLIVTDLCTMEPEPETNEFVVTALHPGVAREQVRRQTGWEVRFAGVVRETEPPRADELETLRDLNARTARAHAAGSQEISLRRSGCPVYPRPQAGDQPVLLYPPYRSTVRRAPQKPAIRIPHTLSELTGPLYGHNPIGETDNDLTRQHAGEPQGERIVVAGRVLDEDGRPIPHTLIELWQCNAAGRYFHARDDHPAPLDPNFTGAGRTMTDELGNYRFVTVKPGAYPWRNHANAWRPAHIHFSLFGPCFLTRLVTQMYFPNDPLMPFDPISQSIPDERARQRLISRFDLNLTEPEWALGYRFDFVLRGRDATPFEGQP